MHKMTLTQGFASLYVDDVVFVRVQRPLVWGCLVAPGVSVVGIGDKTGKHHGEILQVVWGSAGFDKQNLVAFIHQPPGDSRSSRT